MLTFVEYFESQLRTFKFSSKVVFIDEIQVLLNSFKPKKKNQLVRIEKSSKFFFVGNKYDVTEQSASWETCAVGCEI